MDVDQAESPVHLWVCAGAGGPHRFQVALDFSSLTLQDLKTTASQLITKNPIAPEDLGMCVLQFTDLQNN